MEHSGTTGAGPARQTRSQAAQQAPADGAGPAGPAGEGRATAHPRTPGPAGARWRARRDQETPPPPWRVEGMPQDDQGQAGGRPSWSRFWLILLGPADPELDPGVAAGECGASRGVVHVLPGPGEREQRPDRHLDRGHDPGDLPAPGRLPARDQPMPARCSSSPPQRPTFADDNLFGRLQANGVTVNANAAEPGHPAVGGAAAERRSRHCC